ncbi:MAG: dephospho-CoA kinase [Thermotogota bacterium]
MSLSGHISVGITGLMGSGKSEVANFFKRAGYPVLFMDKVGHFCLKEADIIKKLVDFFGQEILENSNIINRSKLSQLVFSDPKKLKELNAILHPKMNQIAKKWINYHFEKGEFIVFLEAAILFEMQMNKFLDYTVLIKATKKDMINRIIKRDQKTSHEIKKILETQNLKEEQVDYVLFNDGSLNELYRNCDKLLRELKSKTII